MDTGATRVLEARAVLLDATASGALDALCTEHGVSVLSLFGSAAAPSADPADLDVAVGFEFGRDGDVVAFGVALSELLHLEGVDLDVMDLGGASITARARALGPDAVPLYESAPGDYARAQMVAFGMELDTAHLRDLQLRTLAGR